MNNFESEERVSYVVIFDSWAGKYGLTGNELIIYGIVYRYSYGENACYASAETMGKITGLSERNVRRILERLVQKRVIARVRRPGKTDLYIIAPSKTGDVPRTKCPALSPSTPDKMSGVPRTKCPDTPDKMSDDIKAILKLDIKETPAFSDEKADPLEGGCRGEESPQFSDENFPSAGAVPHEEFNKQKLAEDEKLDSSESKRKRTPPGSVAPPLAEVKRYFAEAKLTIDPVEFFEYYTQTVVSAGQRPWTDKNGKAIKNWKLKAQTWQRFQGGGKGNDSDDMPDMPTYEKVVYKKLPFSEHEAMCKMALFERLPENEEKAKLRAELKTYFAALGGEEWNE